MIYLDNAASTKVLDNVIEKFSEYTTKYYANPNSSHKLGKYAQELINDNTKSIANILKVKDNEIIYTSGATETNNLVIKGIAIRYKNRGKHIILSALEHNSLVTPVTSLIEAGYEVSIIPINKNGIIDINELKNIIRDDTILISICSVDSEIGLVQPINEIGKMLKEDYPNVIFHTDASQAIGKTNVNFEYCDLVTIAPHKFYGLPNTGILIKKENIELTPQIEGGKSTTIYRSGTPYLAAMASIYEALKYTMDNYEERYEYISKLNNKLRDYFLTLSNVVINSPSNATPYILNISILNKKSSEVVKLLEDYDIIVSVKTSCCPIYTPSKMVYALTQDKKLAGSTIRISLSYFTQENDIDRFIEVFESIK